jgi:hypothetical protein
MTTKTGRAIRGVLALALLLTLAAAPIALAAGPPDDRIMPAGQFTTEKARQLATTHAQALRDLNAAVYHCLPWLEVQKQSIGFFRPKGATQDERNLSIRVYIEQDQSPKFAALRVEERASAMFSRYVGTFLRRMTASRAVMADPALDGFTVILEWQKQAARVNGDRPVHETVAIFIQKSAAAEYLAGRVSIGQLAQRTRVLGWDGETALGQLRLTAWDDNFVATYKVANYELEKGVSCR